MDLFFQEHDGAEGARRRPGLLELAAPGPSQDTADEHDEGAHPVHVQAGGDLQVFLFW